MPHLSFTDENGVTRTHPLDQVDVVIGRQEDCDIVIRTRSVSRRHARVFERNGEWMVEDLGSAFGTSVNDEKVNQAVLEPGDRIALSTEVLTFLEGNAEAAQPARPARPSRPAPIGQIGPIGGIGVVPGVEGMNDELTTSGPLPASEEILASQSIDSSDLLRAIREVRSVDFRQLSSGTALERVERASAGHLVQLVRISDELRRCHGVEAVCRTAVRMALTATRAGRGVIALRQPGAHTFDSIVQVEADKADDEVGEVVVSRTFVNKMVKERVALVAADAGQDAAFSAAKSIVAAQIRSILGTPLWDGDEILGYLYLDSSERGLRFSEDDLNLVTAIGHQAAAEIARLRIAESRRNLSRFVSADVIRHIEERTARGETDASLDAHEQDVTILFSDIKGFTSMSERMKPKDVKLLLDDYFDRMTEIIVDEHGGTLDKYIGDAIMALFGAPFSQGVEKDARSAVAAAVAMRDAVNSLRAKRRVYANVNMRIGLNTGRVVAGMLGSQRRLEYSVLGDAVNVASRLESSGEANRILIGEATYEAVKDVFECEFAGDRKVKNREQPVRAWWVIGAAPNSGGDS